MLRKPIFGRYLAAVIAMCLASSLTPTVAHASHWWWNSSGQVTHLNRGHNPALSFYNKAVNGSWTGLEHARGDWSGQSSAMDLYNLASDSADVVAWDGGWCTDWTGIATPYTHGGGPNTTYTDGHVDHMWVQIDTCDTGGAYNITRAVACHELGHAIGGMFEGTGEGGAGCMGVGYVPGYNVNNAAWRSPNGHDLDHVNWLWSVLH
jgi:prepilin-type processing-associated H-X9-DG protein